MEQQKTVLGPAMAPAIEHFVHTTQRWAAGLFCCYEVADLPATNNDLERTFGSLRYHERRTTGRKTPTAVVLVRGQAHLLACLTSAVHVYSAADLQPRDLRCYQAVRQALAANEQGRRQQRRFRANPLAYLAALETDFLTAPEAPPSAGSGPLTPSLPR
jgi:hypothetical protein